MADDKEEWRPIPDCPGYEVSSWGRARSFRWKAGLGQKTATEPRILKEIRTPKGYFQVSVAGLGGRGRTMRQVHRLVLRVFVGPRPDGMVARHLDNDRGNNRLSNLRWGTPQENMIDRSKAKSNPRQILAESDIPDVWAAIRRGESLAEIARRYGTCYGTIRAIKTGKTWAWLMPNLPGFKATAPDHRAAVLPERSLAEHGQEIWRLVPDYPAYRVSNRGNLQTRWHKQYGIPGGGTRSVIGDRWYPLNPNRRKDGYLWTALSNGQAFKRKTFRVHTLVLEAFVGPKPPGMCACHSDGDRSNNRLDNLRWDTYVANARDREQHAADRA